MAQEIYHRSNWGIASNEWGNTYLNADLTNELYKRAGYYENSWATDKILNKIGTKPSIIMTPTAYSNGILHSVKPVQTLGNELVVNGDFATNSDWNLGQGQWTITNGFAVASSSAGNILHTSQTVASSVGLQHKITFTLQDVTQGHIKVGLSALNPTEFNSDGTYTLYIESSGNRYLYFTPFGFTGKVTNVSVKEVTGADFTFTRGSSATRVNEKGLIQDVQILSDDLVQNGDFSEIGSEEVTNGGFDTDSDWTLETGWSIGEDKAVANVIGTQAIYQSGITLNKYYKVTYTISNYVSGDIRVRVGTSSTPTVRSSNGTFTEYLYATGVDQIRISPFTGGFIGSIDNVSVKEVGQNWSLGTGWSIGDDKANFDSVGQVSNSLLQQSLGINIGGISNIDFTEGENTYYWSNGSSSFKLTFTFTRTSGTDRIRVISSGTNLYFSALNGDNLVGSVTNISVIEITDDTDLPRIDYTDGEGSLLLEPQRTNRMTTSEPTSGGNGFVYNPRTWDNGLSNGLTANDATGGATKYYYMVTGIANEYSTFSFYIEMADGSEPIIGSSGDVNADLSVMVKSYFLSESQVIKTNTINNIWKIEGISLPQSLSGTGQIGVLKYSAHSNKTFYATGFQVEQGSYATSYIPTSGSTVTRAADVCNNAGNSDLINSTEGVLYAEISALANDETNRRIAISDNSTNNRVVLGFATGNTILALVASSGTQFISTIAISDIKLNNKFALKYKENDFALWVNGIEVATDTSGNAPIGLSTLRLEGSTGASDFYGKTKEISYYNTALTDEELQKLTSL